MQAAYRLSGFNRERVIGIAPVGCAVLAYFYMNFDVSEAAHGRTAAVATAIKRVLPDRIVFSYQGDGDLVAIGTAESFHAANRGELISVIFVNNGVYGMTGGQMAPTSLIGQKTTTSPNGRHPWMGQPLRVAELIWDGEDGGVLAVLNQALDRMASRLLCARLELWLGNDPSAEHALLECGWDRQPCPLDMLMVARSFDPLVDLDRMQQSCYVTMGDSDLV